MSGTATPHRSGEVLAAGVALIEASAGTGKTRELTGIVARLVVEDGRRLDEVLVVTFTRAATSELRERIRETLRSARRAVAGGEARNVEEGSQAEELLARWSRDPAFDPEAAARRLEAALEDIDRANVHTIHGFCQRVLSELAFDGGFPFELEVSGDDGELIAGAARDFWRRRVYPASRTFAGYAVEQGFRPGDLAAWVRRWRAKPDLRVVGGECPDTPVEVPEAAWQSVLGGVRIAWEEHREAFVAEVLSGSWLNRGRYRAPRTKSELAAITALLADPEPLLPPGGLFGRYGAQALADACKTGSGLPDNPLFAAFDRLEEAGAELRSAFDAWLRWARREIIDEARESIHGRVLADRRLGYDDLLLELHRRLRGDGGRHLAERIRREYPCALIDEFQDTDPVQADVFMRIYGTTGGGPEGASEEPSERESEEGAGREAPHDARGGAPGEAPGGDGSASRSVPGARGRSASGTDSGHTVSGGLCVVGDPKQSIYRFRGADVFAYLRARDAAHESRSLTRNWRSVPALVEAVNGVFAGSAPFVVPEIEYPRVAPGREHGEPLRIGEAAGQAPLRFGLLPERSDGRQWTKGEAAPFAAGAAAEEIAGLLALAGNAEAGIAERAGSGDEVRPLTGADIAVLVRTRAQGRRVADALRERNVASVEVGDASVFDSREAEQMERLLWALVEPGREARVRGALAGDLFGLDARALRGLEEDEEAWSRWSDRLRGWRSGWSADGVGPLLRRLAEAEGGAARLLRYPDGARRLTNVRHLTDLLQAAEAERRMAPAALAAWFSRRRAEERVRDEDTELRIESDERLVRILTVHGAKGLEFPIVFLPFAWDARSSPGGSSDHAAYHGSEAEGYPEVLDLEPGDAAQAAARREALSEELRLLYVALTRAKYRCVVTWGQVNGAEGAPLAWLLHRGGSTSGPASAEPGAREGGTDAAQPGAVDDAIDAAAARFTGLADRALHEEVRAFAAACPGAVSVDVLDPDGPARPTVLAAPPAVPLAARRLAGPLRRTRQLTSFSALTATAGSSGAPVAHPDVDRPDHDQHVAAEPSPEPGPPVEEEEGRNAFTFPRGPAAGSCLHRIFEELDREAGSERDLDVICRDALAGFDFGVEWRDVARAMVERTRAVCLEEPEPGSATGAEGASRSSIGPGGSTGFRLAEPVPRLVELEFAFPVAGLERARLGASLGANGYRDPFSPSPAGGPDGTPVPPVDGFLRGFVDLVVEHGGRWYVIDYKSNWLGPSPEDYSREAVGAAMRSSAYPLQYLLYLVALHRYLGLRLPGYDYERHVGGVFYLFVRGMDPAAGMERGVWYDRPAASFVHGLDRLFRGGPA